MENIKILVVDDEPRMRKLIRDFLGKEGYMTVEAGDGEQALEVFFKDKDIKLVLLDVMMPKLDGWEVLKEIRQYSKTPVMMLTAKSDEKDELNGFKLGVDEYITKPFSPRILVARVNALLKRYIGDEEQVVEVDGIVIDKQAHSVKIDGKNIELSVKEFELLSYFVANKNKALSRDMILNGVWNYDYYGEARTIDTHVKKLRAKMGEKGAHLTTIWGYGYKFEV